MTKEELKEHCERQIECCEMWARQCGGKPHGKIYEEHKLILDLIKALEQQPCDDCVSRTQAIEWIENLRQMDKCFGNYEDDYFPLFEVIDRLKNVPPVTPTHGTCKECKYSSVHTISLDKIDEIRVCRIQFSKQIKDDYYCADFARREE